MNIVNSRLLNQQLTRPLFASPEDVVAHMGAVQAQEYRLMRWAVAMRTTKPSSESFKNDFNSGRIVRTHLLRGTWQLVAGQDYWWMHNLCSTYARRTILGWMKANRVSISAEEMVSVGDVILRAISGLRSATKEEISKALELAGIHLTDQMMSYHLRMQELEGNIVSGDLLPMKATYSLTSAKIGTRNETDYEESLALLCRKYFQSHSPATFEDFVWWTGIGTGECKKAIKMLGSELSTFQQDGLTFYIHTSCRTGSVAKGHSYLIAPYDEYLLGYKSRFYQLPKLHAHFAHNNSGNFYPIIAHDGIVCGNWSPFSKSLDPRYFEPNNSPMDEEKQWEKYKSF